MPATAGIFSINDRITDSLKLNRLAEGSKSMTPEDPLLSNEPRLRNLLGYFDSALAKQAGNIAHPAGNVEEIVRHTNGSFRKASVLVPVIKPSGTASSHIVLTVRSPNLSSHAGQVSLPGGTRERHDTDAVMTALREAEEEIGLPQDAVQVIGQLGQIFLPSGFEVTPVIGLIDPEPALRPCPIEVDQIFTAPTDLLMNPSSYLESSMEYRGRSRKVLELFYEGFRVWGATAAILHHLASKVESYEQ
jgi:8-oxo-dGTP pyrophosphatase MutT (NUDIX family)